MATTGLTWYSLAISPLPSTHLHPLPRTHHPRQGRTQSTPSSPSSGSGRSPTSTPSHFLTSHPSWLFGKEKKKSPIPTPKNHNTHAPRTTAELSPSFSLSTTEHHLCSRRRFARQSSTHTRLPRNFFVDQSIRQRCDILACFDAHHGSGPLPRLGLPSTLSPPSQDSPTASSSRLAAHHVWLRGRTCKHEHRWLRLVEAGDPGNDDVRPNPQVSALFHSVTFRLALPCFPYTPIDADFDNSVAPALCFSHLPRPLSFSVLGPPCCGRIAQHSISRLPTKKNTLSAFCSEKHHTPAQWSCLPLKLA